MPHAADQKVAALEKTDQQDTADLVEKKRILMAVKNGEGERNIPNSF
jgi:hypothetical protein